MAISLKKKVKAIIADVTGLQDEIDDLDARVTALENPNASSQEQT